MSQMKKNLYDRTVEELRMSVDNIWETIHVQPTEEMPPVVIPVTIEMLSELTDRSVIRTLDAMSDLLSRFSEIPSLSRSSAAKLLNKTPKTLREWEDKGTLVPVYIEGNPYYRLSDIEELNIKKGI